MTGTRILVTGANGFIGRELVPALLEAGFALTLATRGPTPMPDHSAVRSIVTGDLAGADLDPLFADVDTVVHLAGLAHIAKADRAGADVEARFMSANAAVTGRLADAAHRAGIRRFIHLSSLAAITPNANDRVIDDATREPPVTAYGRSKLAAEAHVAALAAAGAFAVSLRPPLVVGAAARGNWASLQRLAATGLPLPFATSHKRRSFISSATLVAAIVTLCRGTWASELSGAYCIADPEPLTLAEVLTQLRAGMGLKPRLFPCPTAAFDLIGAVSGRRRQLAGLTGALHVDASRFMAAFGFVPPLPLSAAIRASGAAYRGNRTASRAGPGA